MTSIAFGAVPGSIEQIGDDPPGAHSPNRNACGVGAKPRAWSPLKPSWPCSTTVNTHTAAGCPRAAVGTAIVIERDAWLAVTVAAPAELPAASANTGSAKPCTSISRDHAESGASV